MIGTYNEDAVSEYQATPEVANFTADVKKDYQLGYDILHRPWIELNNRSVIEDENRGQKMFNAFVDEGEDDPNLSWQWRGTRSLARNKGVAMHAQVATSYLIPIFVAQNDSDETDQMFSNFMRDIVEWMTYPENSDYQPAFLNATIGMLTNPVTYMGAEYCEVYQKIRDRAEDGSPITKEILDEVLSGFRAPVYSASQILITNAYERNIQRQRAVIKRRYVEKAELFAKYGEHENWRYLKAGLKALYNESDGLFYEVFDDEHPNLVEEVTYLNRREDTEVCFLNGIYFGNPDTENNPINHRDNRSAPKYNVVPFGYTRIGQHFFYYKSMMNVLGWENALYDAMSEIVMNRAMLEQNMPIGVTGTDKIDTEIIFPGATVAIENKDARIQPLLPPANFTAGFMALKDTSDSMAASSLHEVASGALPAASQKAYSVAQAQAAAKKIVGEIGKSMQESVLMYGDLMKDIVIQHITVPQAEDIIGKGVKLKYRSFLLPKKNIGGKTVDKMIKFDESLLAENMDDETKTLKNLELLEKTGYPKNKQHLYIINPEIFAKFKYYARVDLKEMFPMNEEIQAAMLTNLYSLLANDPYANREGILRKLLYAYFQSDSEELINKTPQLPEAPTGEATRLNGRPIGREGAQLGNQAQQRQIGAALEG